MENSTVQVPCTKSLNISSSTICTNLKSDIMYVGYSVFNYRGYLYFDLPIIPQNTSINSAYLKIYLTKNPYSYNTGNLYIHSLLESFNDSTNYETQPYYSNNYIYSCINEDLCQWVTIDITSIVQHWYNLSVNNNGLLLKSDEVENSIISFHSNFSCYDFEPKLYINYAYSGEHHCKNTIDIIQQTYTLKTPLNITCPINIERIIQGTFFIKNNGLEAITVFIEVSLDSINWVKDNHVTIDSNKLDFLIPIHYGKYYRVCILPKCIINAEVKFICQVYK